MEICIIAGGIVYYLKSLFMTPHPDSHSITDATPEMLPAVETGNNIQHDGKIVYGITHVHMWRKDNFLDD